MKNIKYFAVAMMAVTGITGSLTSCASKAMTNEGAKAQSGELLKTSQSWDGAQLPDYLVGKPELRVLKVILPPHCSLPKHHHDVMSYGVVTKGQLTCERVRQEGENSKTGRSCGRDSWDSASR